MIILLYIVLGWIILGWILKMLAPWLMRMAVRRAQKRMEKQMRDMFGGRDTSANAHSAYNAPRQPGQSSKKKIIDDEVGEYVRFEEIKETETTTSSTDTKSESPRKNIDYKAEDQIVDVEWEDL